MAGVRADAPATFDATDLLRRDAAAVEQALRGLIERLSAAGAPARLVEAVEYSLLAGGKRLRPTLVLETCRALSGGAPPSAMAAAVAVELVHTFSLVHDDLPAMDDDDLRRGRPTNHKVFGEAMAILAGDAMVSLAFEVLAREAEPALVPALVRELANATGPEGMIGGQTIDMACQGSVLPLDDLARLHRMKTGALLTAACRMGAVAAGTGQAALAAVTEYGRRLGAAFQIVDDLLDVTASPEQLGKATNKDRSRGKNTYPALLGIDASRRAAQEHLAAAARAIEALGPPGRPLAALARFVVERTA